MVLLIAVVAVSTLVLSALISVWLSNLDNLHFPSIGTIRTTGIKAYWDKGLMNQSTQVPWGIVHPGSAYNATVFLRSVSNVKITLRITTSNWTLRNSENIVFGPAERTDFMNMTWDYNGSVLNPGQVIQVTLTLRVEDSRDFIEFLNQNDVTAFSFDIDMEAVED